MPRTPTGTPARARRTGVCSRLPGRAVAACVIALILLASPHSAAQGRSYGQWGSGFSSALEWWPVALYLTEVLIPDLRLEIADDPDAEGGRLRLNISWPITWRLLSWTPGVKHLPSLGFSLAAEPQYVRETGAGRFSGGLRSWIAFAVTDEVLLGLVLEPRGVAASDGHGFTLGSGISIGFGDHRKPYFFITLLHRRTWTPSGHRHDLCLDVSPATWP